MLFQYPVPLKLIFQFQVTNALLVSTDALHTLPYPLQAALAENNLMKLVVQLQNFLQFIFSKSGLKRCV